jgi:hypothetical protein
MKHPETNSSNHLITVEIPSELYTNLLEQVRITGRTESELVIQGLRQVLENLDQQGRFDALEKGLEARLKLYVESLIKDRVSTSQLIDHTPPNLIETKSTKIMPTPTIRALQIGDRVLVLEPDSPYYMAKLVVIKTSLIRATVDTDTGEKIFLKRDLRFVEATFMPIPPHS